MLGALTRRSFLAGATLGSITVFSRTVRAADFTFIQYHNQPVNSSLHRRLVEMWDAIRAETRGRVETQVFPENNKNAGSDPAVLKMLVGGEIQFFTLMGGILGTVVPVAEAQQPRRHEGTKESFSSSCFRAFVAGFTSTPTGSACRP